MNIGHQVLPRFVRLELRLAGWMSWTARTLMNLFAGVPSMLRLVRAGALLLACLTVAAAPPPAPTDEYTETLFGTTVNDPYRWMETGGAAFDEWLTAEG